MFYVWFIPLFLVVVVAIAIFFTRARRAAPGRSRLDQALDDDASHSTEARRQRNAPGDLRN